MYERQVLLGFMRIHILHHATEKYGIYGVWMIRELERHGYDIGPGTLYPMLHDMERSGLMTHTSVTVNGKVRKVYRATREGKSTLRRLKGFVRELAGEVI